MKSPARALLLLIVLALVAGPPAVAQSVTEVRATVRMADGEVVVGVPVALEINDGQRNVQSLPAETDAAGSAAWPQIAVLPSYRARIAATVEGVVFYSELQPLRVGESLDLDVIIAEVTAYGRPLHLDTLHMIIQIDEPGVYRVLQFMTVSNAGETAWAGGPELRDGRRAGIIVPLPAGASGTIRAAPFPSETDALPPDMQIDVDRVLDPRPVPPGGRQVAVTYDLVSDGEPVPVLIEVPYPTQSVSVLIGGAAASSVVLTDTSLQQQPAETIGDNTFELWTAEAVGPGTEVRFTLGPSANPLSTQTLALFGLGLALVLASLATLRGDAPPAHAREQHEILVERAALLDLQYDEDAIGAVEYFHRRGAAIEQLMLLEAAMGRVGSSDADRPGPGDGADDGA